MINEADKSQFVRLLDMFLFGPAMIAIGLWKSNLPMWLKMTSIIMGLGTIIYNANNYLINRKK